MSKRKYIKDEGNNDDSRQIVNGDNNGKLKRRKVLLNQEKRLKNDSEFFSISKWRSDKFQSPVNVNTVDCIKYDQFTSLAYNYFWHENGKAVFTNNGSTALFRFDDDQVPLLHGGPLGSDEYVFDNLHFHWGTNDEDGSEHIVNGKRYAMEAHLVHFKKKYKNFNNAFNKSDGLAVLSFFLEATDDIENYEFRSFSRAASNIVRKNSSVGMSPDSLKWLLTALQCKGYYTYQGSLTTKPYTENVTWIIFPTPLKISREQVTSYRNLESSCCDKKFIKNNVRPIQMPPENKKLDILYVTSHI